MSHRLFNKNYNFSAICLMLFVVKRKKLKNLKIRIEILKKLIWLSTKESLDENYILEPLEFFSFIFGLRRIKKNFDALK